MTERVDHDRLADFVGGALDGTPDAAAVRALIETDPGWAAAHADLVVATAAVSADLRSLGSRTHAVPEDVAARLDALLRPLESDRRAGGAPATVTGDGPGEPTATGDGRAQSTPGGPRGAAAGTRGAVPAPGGPGGSSRPGGGTGPGRRTRRMRWAAGLSAAAAVIAVGVGFVSLLPAARNDPSASSGERDAAGGAAATQLATGGPTVIVSGRDYRPGSFGDLNADARSMTQPTPAPPGAAAEPQQGDKFGDSPSTMDDATRSQVPPDLRRLTGPDALQNCLDAIRLVHGGTPSVVEYARFTGRPALVVLLDGSTTGQGRRWVVVAGPDCGLAAGDADELYNGPLA